jgi:hypothetical protein
MLNVIKRNHLGSCEVCVDNNIKMHLRSVYTECEGVRWVEISGMGYMVIFLNTEILEMCEISLPADVVMGYETDGKGIAVRFPRGAIGFFFLTASRPTTGHT